MQKKKNPLPPLDYILAFEATANCESFVGASKLLNISETAISRKVKLLELHYNTSFFLRRHKLIKLTSQGQSFLDKVSPALEILRDVSAQTIVGEEDQSVTLAATNSVASLWLMPKLRIFNRAHKHLKIMLVASDSDEECLAETVDLSILRGDGNWPGYQAKLLFGETIFPVCSPDFLKANPQASKISNLNKLALIDVSSNHSEWMNWATWLSHKQVSSTKYHQVALFNTYPLSIQAAVDGLGIALGWGHLVDHLLEEGKLVRPLGSIDIRTKHGYYLLSPEKSFTVPASQIVENWLLSISAKRKRYRDLKVTNQ
ncbi:LysR family transcriptional regulator [Kiloniella spongiae]|uniref:LysR family transcriptional regulator n=1 Tax=Kiloniella spongiae TaxID=1489064 RepID=A0A0H2MA71_9PROT|nr:LysR substrate-binding domain-containing protein [Kiloniella spongiae]KLN59076.1 LysR family transcriptional regulator [Kiloniella spongiae]